MNTLNLQGEQLELFNQIEIKRRCVETILFPRLTRGQGDFDLLILKQPKPL